MIPRIKTEEFGRIGVLMGGISSERDISLSSGKAISKALKRQGCSVVPLDIVDGEENKILFFLQEANIDIAFIALHGQLGEDGVIQSILEKADIPYTGSGIEASRLTINKPLTQNLFRKNDIMIPSYVTLAKGEAPNIRLIVEELGAFPVIVKPACEGSSIGTSLVKSQDELSKALKCAWRYDATIMLEQYIKGRELTVGILDDDPLPVVEICPKHDFFNFDAKYTKGKTEYIVPAELPDDIANQLQETALKAHQLLGCADFSRVDFMMDDNNTSYVLEVNTIPGFTSTSLLPKAALEKGIDFDQLCLKLTELAYGKKKEIKNTTLR